MTRRSHAFDPELLLRTLVAHDVRFVLIGGWAAKLQGSPTVTADIDICYARDPDDLERLAAALSGLDVQLRGVDDKIPFRLDDRSLRAGDTFTLTTSLGDVDLIATPAGSGGYEALVTTADMLELDDISVAVASIGDLIVMKRAAGRPKDLIEVEILKALQAEVNSAGNQITNAIDRALEDIDTRPDEFVGEAARRVLDDRDR